MHLLVCVMLGGGGWGGKREREERRRRERLTEGIFEHIHVCADIRMI